ncbi:MAG: InlB B-repeat-containing protein [Bacteroidaceae bacterium]|nr:InlB B-repeat-containing protein [Bacteroidaceae bacterium]
MKKGIACLLFLLLALCGLKAQSISQYEYWTDDDNATHSVVNAGASEISLRISTESLAAGIHFLNFRAMADDGTWGNFYRFMYYIPSLDDEGAAITGYEYWFDDDYAHKVAGNSANAEQAFSIDISQLPSGVHCLNYWPIGDKGRKGNVDRILFYIGQIEDNSTANHLEYEYWFDSDTEHKFTGEGVTGEFVFNIDVADLEVGKHTFNFRAKDLLDQWTEQLVDEFTILPPPQVTYKVDGETFKTVTYGFGATIVPEPEPTKEGYTFSGWSEIPEIIPDDGVTVTGTFTVNKYLLEYIVDGDTVKSDSIAYATAITPLELPVKEGYTFSGWSEIPETMPAGDVTVTGSFKINTYLFCYKLDGEIVKSDSIVFATKIIPLEEPSKEGYTFSGWSEIPNSMPANDVEIVGNFTVNKYLLEYIVDGDTVKSDSVAYATAITPLEEPSREGYSFSGWSAIPDTMPANDVVVTGSFTINKYNAVFRTENGTVVSEYNIDYGQPMTLPEASAKYGYTFIGWGEKVDGVWSIVEAGINMPARNMELTAVYKANMYAMVYVVDGEVYHTDSISYEAVIHELEYPIKEGYTFSGWSAIPDTMPANDLTVTGSFEINKYLLTYEVDGEIVKSDSIVFATEIIPLEEPIKEGYTFSGWSEIPDSMPAKAVLVTGTFVVNKYLLAYYVDGEEYKSDYVAYKSFITPIEEPAKSGYTFSGWSAIPDTMPMNDVIVTGSFTLKTATAISVNKREITFNSFDTQTLGTIISPDDLINRTISWSSSDADVVYVNEAGVVTPVNNGTAYIIATTTDGTELSDSCLVTIDFKASKVKLSNSSLVISKFEGKKLTATVTPDKASQNVKWSSSDTTVVKVDDAGNIMPAKNGSATITATTTDGTNLKATCSIRVNIKNMFKATSTQTTVALGSNAGVGEVTTLKALLDGVEYDLSGEDAKITGLAPGETYHIVTTAVIDGNDWKEEIDVTMKNITVNFDCAATATTLEISANYDVGDATLVSASFDSEDEVDKLTLLGLDPEMAYKYTYYLTTEEGGTATYKGEFSTKSLELKISQTKVVSIGNVVVVATSNITEEEDVNVGFEWRRYDWPDEINSNSGAAYIYEGNIEGSIKSLNADKFWKIRPYFQSQSGNWFYGDWLTVDPSNTSYFEPSVHTYAKKEVEGNTVEVKGYALGGSDQVKEQGFKYWEVIPSSSSPKYPQATEIPSFAKTVTATGQLMTAEFTNLQYEMEYHYVAFVTTSDGMTYYGEQQSFKIDDPVGIKDAKAEDADNDGNIKVYSVDGALIYSGAADQMKLRKGMYVIKQGKAKSKKMLVK